MKILIITQYFYPENFRINDFAFRMAKRGHEVSVLTGVPNYPEGKPFGKYKNLGSENIKGVAVYRVPLIARGKSRGFELALNYISFLISAFIFGPFLLRKVQPSIIFSINYSPATVGLVGVFFSKIKKAPLALWVQDLWPDSLIATGAVRSGLILGAVRSMVKFIYSKSKIIFIQSRAFKKSILPLGFSNGKKISYLPNWAEDDFNNDSKFIDDPFAKLIPRDKFIIMFAGNLGVAQSLSTIINAAIEVKNSNIHWVFLGDGRQKNWLDNVVADARLQSSISILGRYPLEDMPRFFKLADVMLVTLKTDKAFSMTVPGKIQSYLRNAKPILSALDGEGAAVIKESGAGLNVNTEDSAGLAKAAHAMSKLSQKELDKMGINASAYYNKNFDVDVLLTQFENEVNLKCF